MCRLGAEGLRLGARGHGRSNRDGRKCLPLPLEVNASSGGDVQVRASKGTGRGRVTGDVTKRELLEVLLQSGVSLLCGGEIARLERLAELAEECGDGLFLAGGQVR